MTSLTRPVNVESQILYMGREHKYMVQGILEAEIDKIENVGIRMKRQVLGSKQTRFWFFRKSIYEPLINIQEEREKN